ncbi:hypothetical protein TRSC58_00685 [Trypanosoma rangeli SC58]|uniref:Actin-like protein n=1 Tax=Trypanosoma rangeli SC58 TaxID=429131 RepID=A0A061JBY2_TRYRA|nr:hypothetical protein TRSC58_00685 [Trypanosoma rangeli SC58]
MLNSTGVNSHSLQSTTAASDTDGRLIVLVVGELATYLCRSGEIRPFLEDAPIPEEVLRLTPPFSLSLTESATSLKQKKALQLVSRLREHVLDRNIVVVLPMHVSSEYREKVVMFLFARLEVRTIIVLSDLVADTFGAGLRESLVLHASLRALSVGRVESGVTVKYAASVSGSPLHLLKFSTARGEGCCDGQGDVGSKAESPGGTKEEEKEEEGEVNGEERDGGDALSLFLRLSLGRSFSSATAVDLLDEQYRGVLFSYFGEEVYQRVVASQEFREAGMKRRRDEAKEKVESAVARTNDSLQGKRGVLKHLIATITDGASLPVIVTGEALRVVPLLRNFLEETVRECGTKFATEGALLSSSASLASSSTTDGSDSSKSFSLEEGGLLHLQPLPLQESPWMLSLLGGSLVSQLSLGELSRLRISREDALSSKGGIIHWRSVL